MHPNQLFLDETISSVDEVHEACRVPPVMKKTRPDWSGMSVLGSKEAFDILKCDVEESR